MKAGVYGAEKEVTGFLEMATIEQEDMLDTWITVHRGEIHNKLLEWWKVWQRSYPWRRPFLSAYEVLLVEMLLKRTTATAVAKIFGHLYREYYDIRLLAKAPLGELENRLKCLGLQKQRARALKEMAIYICEHEGGEIPKDLERLLKIPHVGPYTARAVLCFAYGEPTGVVDSNVVRVIRRLCKQVLPPNPQGLIYQKIADRLVPEHQCREFNWALLDFGALVCRYSYMKCDTCPLRSLCTSLT